MVMNAVRGQTHRFPVNLPRTANDALKVAMAWPNPGKGGAIDSEDQEEALIVGCRDFRAAMVAAGAVVAHERYALGYSDPRGLTASRTEFDRAIAGIVRELRLRRKSGK